MWRFLAWSIGVLLLALVVHVGERIVVGPPQ
jgi:hypothetical protein